MKVKTSELTGQALDWAVAKCEGKNSIAACYYGDNDIPLWLDEAPNPTWEPSTNWAQGGPIIEREKIDVMWCGDRWCAYTMTPNGQSQLVTDGNTPLLAAMRGFVASKLGDEVEVPEELI